MKTLSLRARRPQRERGLAMVALLSLLAMIGAYYIANGLARTAKEAATDADLRTQQALKQAKAALIAYAAQNALDASRPGSLPCPDLHSDSTTNNEPASGNLIGTESSCTSSTLIGRLPWSKLGVGDLRDSAGERLWYAVSNGYRSSNTNSVLNTETQGAFTVTGTTPQSRVIAVILAPGQAISSQSRTSSGYSTASNYLEGTNATSGTTTFQTQLPSSDSFNDQLVAITEADLWNAVEPVIASRLDRDVKPFLTAYYQKWGAFPFPAPFNPGGAQSTYTGSSSLQYGLLPVVDGPSYAWVSGQGAVNGPLTGSTSGATISGTSCATTGSGSSARWRCSFTAKGPSTCSQCLVAGYTYTLVIQVDGQISNVGLSLATYQTATGCSEADKLLPPASCAQVTGTTSSTATALGFSLVSSGNARARYEGTLQMAYSCSFQFFGVCFTPAGTTVTVTLPIYAADSARLDTNGTLASWTGTAADAWFINNQWYKQTYYSVTGGCLPGGSSCSAGLTVKPVNSAAKALLVLAGRPLVGSVRPPSTTSLTDYFEGSYNTVPANHIFEHRYGSTPAPPTGSTSGSINDRVVVLAQ